MPEKFSNNEFEVTSSKLSFVDINFVNAADIFLGKKQLVAFLLFK